MHLLTAEQIECSLPAAAVGGQTVMPDGKIPVNAPYGMGPRMPPDCRSVEQI